MVGTRAGVGFTVMVNLMGELLQAIFGVTKLPKAYGSKPTLTFFTTLFVAVLITDTLSELVLATYTVLPSGLTDTPHGRLPTPTVAISIPVAVLITETVYELLFATYNFEPSGLTARPVGALPGVKVDITLLVKASMTEILFDF